MKGIRSMKKFFAKSLIMCGAIFIGLQPAQAHHSSTPHFDRGSTIQVEGTITELKFVNPHAYLYFDVEQQDGTIAKWRCELAAAAMLKRAGWSEDMFTVGAKMVLTGAPAWREENVCLFSNLVMEDGSRVDRRTAYQQTAPLIAPDEAAKRPLYLENGQPNLQGPWLTQSFGRDNRNGFPARFRPSAAGKAAVGCLLYTSPSPRDATLSRMPSSA